jgi:hypothetical protein
MNISTIKKYEKKGMIVTWGTKLDGSIEIKFEDKHGNLAWLDLSQTYNLMIMLQKVLNDNDPDYELKISDIEKYEKGEEIK